MLSLGKQNLQVVRLQLQMRALDLYSGFIDGQFSKDLDIAVRAFQKKSYLLVDGIVGPVTSGVLKKITQNKWFLLFGHASSTPEGRNDSAEKIKLFHTLEVTKGGRGWSRPGYADIIELHGDLKNIHSYNSDNLIHSWEYTFGVHPSTLLNRNARHFCYIGGMDKTLSFPKDTRTAAQLKTMETYIKYQLLLNKKLVIAGHNQVQNKACPCFDMPAYLKDIGIDPWNIAQWGEMRA